MKRFFDKDVVKITYLAVGIFITLGELSSCTCSLRFWKMRVRHNRLFL